MAKKKTEKFQNDLGHALLGSLNPYNTDQVSKFQTLDHSLRRYLISNQRTDLSWAFVEIGLIRTICTVPVEDAMRGGIEIKTKQLDPEEIELLDSKMEEEGDLSVLSLTAIWNRLFGGAGTIIATDEDPQEEFTIDNIKKGSTLSFRSADLWELFWAQQMAQDGMDLLNVNQYDKAKTFAYYGIQVNKSRVMTMKGLPPPSFLRPTLRGWGVSEIENLIRSINQYLKTSKLIFEVLDEFKIDVFKLKNLASTLLQKNGTEKIQQRIQLANMQKNFQHALVMDSEDDHSAKELSFSGISETLEGIRMQIASDMRIPLTKLFGISAAGFSSGEDDIENYNAMIESSIRAKIKPHAIKMVQMRCMQLFGYVPDDLTISFKSLRILSAVDEETVKTAKHSRLLATASAGFCTAEEFKEGCNKDELLPVQLDTTIDKIEIEGNAPSQSEGVVSASTSSTKPPIARNSDDKFENPGKVNEEKWKAAKEKCMKEYGKIKWAVVTTIYEDMGGTFQ